MFVRLLQNRRKMARNYLSSLSPALRALALVGALVLAVAGFFLIFTWLSEMRRSGERFVTDYRLWAFRLNFLTMMVVGYGALNTLYRDKENRVLHNLPLRMGAYFWYKLWRIGTSFLILPLLELYLAAGLLLLGETRLFFYSVAFFLPCYLFVVLVGGAIQMHAGAGMLSGYEQLKKMLVGPVAPQESAFFYYAPAGALASAAIFAIFWDLMLKTWLFDGLVKPLIYGAVVFIVSVAWFLRSTRRVFCEKFPQIVPKFNEIDVTPDLIEGDQQRRHYLGHQLASLLSGQARAIFTKDWLAFRRRFRVVPLLIVMVVLCFAYLSATTGSAGSWRFGALLTLCGAGVLFFNPSFKLFGGDIESDWVVSSFPIQVSGLVRAKALSGVALTIAIVVPCAAVYGLFSSDWLGAALLLGAAPPVIVGAQLVGIALARRLYPDVQLAAALYYGVVILSSIAVIALT